MEFALLLPLVLALALAVVQFALVIRTDVLVHEAAREAVRAAALDPEPGAGAIAARRLVPDARIEVARGGIGEPVRATVRLRYVTALPLIGPLFPDVDLHGSAEMRAER